MNSALDYVQFNRNHERVRVCTYMYKSSMYSGVRPVKRDVDESTHPARIYLLRV